MYQVDLMSRTPVYAQIIEQTKQLVLCGVLAEGDRIPPVRQISEELSINPNTIAKAFRQMEQDGLICTAYGKGSFISPRACSVLETEARGKLAALEEQIRTLSRAGIKKAEIQEVVNKAYKSVNGNIGTVQEKGA